MILLWKGTSTTTQGTSAAPSFHHSPASLLSNGESGKWPWLMYLQSADWSFTFTANFSKNTPVCYQQRFNNLSNLHTMQCEHDHSKNHVEATLKFWRWWGPRHQYSNWAPQFLAPTCPLVTVKLLHTSAPLHMHGLIPIPTHQQCHCAHCAKLVL